MKELNLAKNNITNLSCKSIAQLVSNTENLSSLNLHWNALKYFKHDNENRGEGAVLILDAINKTAHLRVLDLGWNNLGSNTKTEFAQKMSKIVKTMKSLLHVDLSNNRISEEDCTVIGEGLEYNHTIWGIHMIGNDAMIDPKGFLISGKFSDNPALNHMTKRINGGQMVDFDEGKAGCNCWICEGWNEVKFEFEKSIFIFD